MVVRLATIYDLSYFYIAILAMSYLTNPFWLHVVDVHAFETFQVNHCS